MKKGEQGDINSMVKEFFEQDCTEEIKSAVDFLPDSLGNKVKELFFEFIEELMQVVYTKGYLRAFQERMEELDKELLSLKKQRG